MTGFKKKQNKKLTGGAGGSNRGPVILMMDDRVNAHSYRLTLTVVITRGGHERTFFKDVRLRSVRSSRRRDRFIVAVA